MVYLVDAEGKLVTDETVYVEVGASGNPNACVLSLCSQNQELSDIIAAWGKTTAVFSSQELGTPDYTITIGGDFVDVVEETATPTVAAYSPSIEGITPELPTSQPYQTITVEMTAPVDKSEVVSNLKGVVVSGGVDANVLAFEEDGSLYMGSEVGNQAFQVQISGTTISILDNSGGHSGYTVKEITWGV